MREAPRPVVSVCIANYNGERLLDACIGSVLAQENAPRFEIIVHDDASTDGSAGILERYPSLRVIRSDANVGFCVSNNRMAAIASGDFLLLLNNDAMLLPDALATLMRTSQERCHRAVLGMAQYDARDGSLVDVGCWLDPFFSPVRRHHIDEAPPATVIGACMWIPRTMWNEIGGFPEFFRTNAEDVYLCCAARWLGYDVAVTPSSGFLHRAGVSLGGGKAADDGRLEFHPQRRYLSERNRILLMCVFLPVGVLQLALALNTVLMAIEASVLALMTRSLHLMREVHVKAHADAWSMRHEARLLRFTLRSRQASAPYGFYRRFRLLPSKIELLARYGLPRVR